VGSLTKTLAALALVGLIACGGKSTSTPPEAPSTTCRVKTVGRTVGAAAKTGAVAAADGVVQVGSATAGLLQDGKDGAKSKWKARGAETKQDARENAAETEREAHRPNCN
jgi:hypothetical protein